MMGKKIKKTDDIKEFILFEMCVCVHTHTHTHTELLVGQIRVGLDLPYILMRERERAEKQMHAYDFRCFKNISTE